MRLLKNYLSNILEVTSEFLNNLLILKTRKDNNYYYEEENLLSYNYKN